MGSVSLGRLEVRRFAEVLHSCAFAYFLFASPKEEDISKNIKVGNGRKSLLLVISTGKKG